MIKRLTLFTVSFFLMSICPCFSGQIEYQPKISIGGFYDLKNSDRKVFNFNVGWRFHKGDIPNAETTEFNDSNWNIVSTPHTVQLMPAEASGSRNYQGVAWYRKHFTVNKDLNNKLINIYFEAAMGKSTVYLNGKEILTHLGGYLPFSIELTQLGIKAGDECLIAVKTDNSDNKNFPPGKKQTTLDFTYHGGIYRDVWMIATSKTFITDPNKTNKVAGGGIFVQFGDISKTKAELIINTDIHNADTKGKTIIIHQNW